MKKIKDKILALIKENEIISQRKIGEYLGISLGSVNKYINTLLDEGKILKESISYRKTRYTLTETGEASLKGNNKKIRLAVILSAGETVDFDRPVGFLKVGEEELIERTIGLLLKNGIEKIIIVVGYKSEYYKPLYKKYPQVKIIENKKYKVTGNMYSLYLARGEIQEDFLLLEGDLIFEEKLLTSILKEREKNLTLIDREISNREDALYVTTKKRELLNISKGKYSLEKISGELIGMSLLKYTSYLKMLDKFTQIENKLFFYEYSFLDKNIFPDLKCLPVAHIVWGEIDNEKQYEYIKKNILEKL